MIEVKNLTKSYGGTLAISDLSFQVQKGEVVGFLGPNGAGKSTTMKIITGFMAPTNGSASIAGFDVFEEPLEVKKRIGYLPETPPVYTDMFVQDYLYFVAALKGVPKEKIQKNVQRAIDKTNLGSVQNRLIHNLSKGFRQRVGIAQAIVSDPEVLILDEPTVGLDPKQVSEIRELIKELKSEHTIILSTHILPEVEATCERIIIINKGKIVAQEKLNNLAALQTGAKRIILKVKNPKNILSELTKIKSIINFEEERPGEILITTNQSDGVLEDIASLVITTKSGLLEISSGKGELEDIFIRLTYGEGAKQGSAHV